MSEQEDTIKSLIQDGDLTKFGEKLLFNPYNSENIEITLNDVQSILSSYGITAKVNNLELSIASRACHHARERNRR